ncbi:FAD-binding oxidoreductase [Wenxinia saemankumensis]|uniref:NAD(P)/FAD-dependent oxidoreductase n=1 Tax=Wenxinia saemankumensis TaxID=1447782 RepID=UPI000A4CDCAB
MEEYGIPAEFFDPAGKINGAASAAAEAHNASYAAHIASPGEASEALDARAMREVTGSPHYRSGLYTPGTVMLQPAGFVRGLAAGLARQVRLHEDSAVTGFDRRGTDWQVRTAAGCVTTPRILLTVNGHLESFGVERGRLMQVFLFASMTGELDGDARARLGGHEKWGITPSDPMGTTMRRIGPGQGGHRLVTRTAAVVRPGMKVGASDLARATAIQPRKFDQRFPALAGLPFEHSWAGHLCLTLNGVAVARQIDEGIFSGCVQNGLGTTRGTLTGIAAAEMATGHASDLTRHFAAGARPRPLPPAPFGTMGANAVLRWKEWRAGAE